MIIPNCPNFRRGRRWSALLAPALLAAAATTSSARAGGATGVLADRNETLKSLDALYLNDPSAGAHFSGARVTSVLDAGVSTYSSSTGSLLYWATRPGVPNIQVGKGLQTTAEDFGRSGALTTDTAYLVPKEGGGTVRVSVAYGAATHAVAGLSNGILRNSADNNLIGPTVAVLPAAGYDGFGAYGTAYSRSEAADYLHASSAGNLHLTGTWDGSLTAGATGGTGALSSPAVLAKNPVNATAHMEISLWSAPQAVLHPGDEESPAFTTYERTYLGGVSFDETAAYGQSLPNIHRSFDLSIPVPAGGLYFYAAQWVSTGGQTDATQGVGGSVYTDSFAGANFDHTLSFDLVPDAGVLSSESGEFLTAVPEPGEWTALAGAGLGAWALIRRGRRSRPA